jgi:hypothetical protein
MTELMQKVLAEVKKLPAPEQDTLAGLMLAHLIRKESHIFAQAYNTKLWARLREEDPDYVRSYDESQQRNAKKAEHFIGLILLVDWDPVGVFGIPATEREYAQYVPGVHELLLSYPRVEVVADHLYRIEREKMGLSKKDSEWQAARRAVLVQVAQKLVSLSSEWRLEAPAEGLGD